MKANGPQRVAQLHNVPHGDKEEVRATSEEYGMAPQLVSRMVQAHLKAQRRMGGVLR